MLSEIRAFGGTLYYRGLRTLHVPAVRRRWGNAGVILCYHNVIAADDRSIGAPGLHLPFNRFARQVRWLAEHYEVVSLGEFVRHRSARTERPLAAITFDDGYAGVFKYAAPLLDRLGIPATVFVVADAAGRSAGFWWDQPQVVTSLTPSLRERWLSDLRGDEAAILSAIQASRGDAALAYRPADWSTIRAHAAGTIEIGVHSSTHRFLPALTGDELEHEIVASRKVIHRETGVWSEFFAYPYGSCDARVREAVRSAGYRGAFGLDADSHQTAGDVWALSRVSIPSGISDQAFEAWTAGLR